MKIQEEAAGENVNAVDLIENLYEEQNVIISITRVIFATSQGRSTDGQDDEERLSYNLGRVRTFNIVKDAIWSCAQTEDEEGESLDKLEQDIDLNLLSSLMRELMVYIKYYELRRLYQART